MNMTKHWNSLPRELMESPALETLQKWPWAASSTQGIDGVSLLGNHAETALGSQF